MCIFSGKKPDWHRVLTEDEAVVGYKTLEMPRVDKYAEAEDKWFSSPIQLTPWKDHKLTSHRIPAASGYDSGIYAYAELVGTPLRPVYDEVVVKVKLWGKVVHYPWEGGYRNRSGFRAQHAEIIEVVAVDGDDTAKRARRRAKKFGFKVAPKLKWL